MGVRLQQSGDLDGALREYARALELAPDFVEAHNNLGTLLGARGRSDEAIRHLQRAVELRPQQPAVHANLGIALYLAGRHGEAETALSQAITGTGNDAAPLGYLGEIAMECGALARARTYYERALALAPNTGWLYRRWAETAKVRPDDPTFVAMCGIDLDGLPSDDRAQLHFALGKAYDDLDDYARAFKHFHAGNALRRSTLAYDEAATLAALERIRSAFSRELLTAKSGAGDASRAPVFVVGMPRSGTTLVEQILSMYPNVAACGEIAELGRIVEARWTGASFPADAAERTAAFFGAIGSEYVERVVARHAAARVTDKTLSNLELLGIVAAALPNARVVYVRRDPLDACFSCYAQCFREGMAYSYDLGELGRYYRAYAALARHWHDVLPPGMLLEVRYESLVSDAESEARRIVEHCGLEWMDGCLDFHRSRRIVSTASAAAVRRPLYASSVGRSDRYRRWLAELTAALGS